MHGHSPSCRAGLSNLTRIVHIFSLGVRIDDEPNSTSSDYRHPRHFMDVVDFIINVNNWLGSETCDLLEPIEERLKVVQDKELAGACMIPGSSTMLF